MSDEQHDPFADVPSDPLADEEPAEAPPEEAAIEPTTDESLGGFDLPDPATEPEPEEIPTPVESSETDADPEVEQAIEAEAIAFEESGSEYDPEPAASEPVGPEDLPEPDGSVTPAEAPVAPEPEPEPEALPDPEPPEPVAASNGSNGTRTYLCFEEADLKGGGKGWKQVTEVEARNVESGVRLAYRKLCEQRDSEEPANLVLVSERMFKPKPIKWRERRSPSAIEVG